MNALVSQVYYLVCDPRNLFINEVISKAKVKYSKAYQLGYSRGEW